MPESFKAAMPYPIKFSTSENEYEDQDRFPQKFSMFIPCESVSAFCEEVMKMVDTKQKKVKFGIIQRKKKSKSMVFTSTQKPKKADMEFLEI
ncbi:MAG: hypothetical protein CM15mV73_040 [Caudoviricetes sp.]|nr:MAG: hypothetical protein CM15mV73_040 [Caudoviricetes sp.]